MILIPATVRLLDAALAGDDALAEALGHGVEPGWATFAEALRLTRDAVAACPGREMWGPRLFLHGDPRRLVGWGGFKARPRDGVVEIGYEIAEGVRGRGLASAAAAAMLAEAFADELVTAVTAHTLPEPNASNYILAKLGFRHESEVEEDGDRVWRFVLRREERP